MINFFMRFLIFLFVILTIIGTTISFIWYQYRYDFLISLVINFINAMLGYIVSKNILILQIQCFIL